MLEKFYDSLLSKNDIHLDDVNFDEDDPEATIHIRLLAWRNKFEKDKSFKKD